jgi:pimeloyl-ACP methyl ester carboxylesterase
MPSHRPVTNQSLSLRPTKAGAFLLVGLLALLAAACGKPTPKPQATPQAPPRPVATAPAATPTPAPAPTVVAAPRFPAALTRPVPVQAEAVSLWSDEFLFAGWRIQRQFYSGQSRLVDARGFQRAVGSYAACKEAFDYLRTTERVVPRSRRLVLLLHGLGSTPTVMKSLERAIEADGFDAMTVTYPTTEQGVANNADSVERLLSNLEGYSEVAVVAHSLGGLITRATLSRPSFATLPVPVRTVVMLGTPNQGASLAEMLRPLARMAATASANDLIPARARQIGPIPKVVRFGVIAGGTNNRWGYNPILGADNDGVVKVSEARAQNMADFLLLPVTHTAMTEDVRVANAVRQFLRTGTFRAPPRVG